MQQLFCLKRLTCKNITTRKKDDLAKSSGLSLFYFSIPIHSFYIPSIILIQTNVCDGLGVGRSSIGEQLCNGVAWGKGNARTSPPTIESYAQFLQNHSKRFLEFSHLQEGKEVGRKEFPPSGENYPPPPRKSHTTPMQLWDRNPQKKTFYLSYPLPSIILMIMKYCSTFSATPIILQLALEI